VRRKNGPKGKKSKKKENYRKKAGMTSKKKPCTRKKRGGLFPGREINHKKKKITATRENGESV